MFQTLLFENFIYYFLFENLFGSFFKSFFFHKMYSLPFWRENSFKAVLFQLFMKVCFQIKLFNRKLFNIFLRFKNLILIEKAFLLKASSTKFKVCLEQKQKLKFSPFLDEFENYSDHDFSLQTLFFLETYITNNPSHSNIHNFYWKDKLKAQIM